MIKIAALNDESEEDSDSEDEVTREALEEIALQQYAKALELQRKGNLTDALQLLKDLLETELLDDVKKPAPGEKRTEPLFNLKYLCYKNVASIQSSTGEIENAIESYTAAAGLDDSDVTLWYRLGLLCMQAQEYERALHSFQCGADRNPRHWPCLDKILTLQMALGYYNDCMATIYTVLQLDTGYLRGLVYRRHIFTNYPYITDFLIYLDPKYKLGDKDNEPIEEEEQADKLLKEAESINKIYLEQLKSEEFKYVTPQLKLKKPITNLSWHSVGESLVHMHNYMSENCYSHTCIIEVSFDKDDKQEVMEVCEEQIQVETIEARFCDVGMDVDKNIENGSDENNELSDRAATDTEKVESDADVPATETVMDAAQSQVAEKETKKTPVRRRGSALKLLEQWEWCNKRRSGRKKTVNKQDRLDDNIYDTLRRMVPTWLKVENKKSNENEVRENSPDTMDLYKLFDDKDNGNAGQDEILDYFGTETEQKDVNEYIDKYCKNKCDIIELLNEFLGTLAAKWKLKWPQGLRQVFVAANRCYSNHIEVPSCTDDNLKELLHYTAVNMLCEEFVINDKLNCDSEKKQILELNVIESIGMSLIAKPNFFASDCLELMLRFLWVKLHIYLSNKCEELALDCLYQLFHEFNAMGEQHDSYYLEVPNFTFKPLINENEVTVYIKFMERNKQLSSVLELYERGSYEEVLSIVIESFEHYKNVARKQDEEMSLDFAGQLSLILDCYWALGKVDECFKWSLTCLHEALKHYFTCNAGSTERNKWSLAVVKVLCCIEHILSNEGLSCLDTLSQSELSVGLEDLIRIIGHQVDTTTSELPFETVVPWLIMHYVLQREDDQGRAQRFIDKDAVPSDEIPSPLMVLFLGHEQLGKNGWCCKNDGKLLYFILDTVVPRLRSPSLSRTLEQVLQYMEQCVFCLFGHPGKKTKLRYLSDHNATPHSLDWNRAQQLYEIFRPTTLPEVEGKVPSIPTDTEQLFHRILALLPTESEPQKYLPDMEKYISGIQNKLPVIPPLLPYKMKDIYFLMGDYYFKKEERKMSVKYNMYDVIVNNDRCESWAEIALAKAVNLELKINSCINIDNEKDYLSPARAIIKCFQRALELDTLHCNLWIEYGVFVYSVYSFCSRLLKQASESLSMSDFESFEKQKEDMLNTTQKCFTTVIQDRLSNSHDNDKVNDEMWLHYYMMGKVAEKRNKPPSVYLDHYLKAVKSLHEADAIYPLRINYNTPQHLSIEVSEVHYRIHASILKYIEQHENKPIPMSVGKVFIQSLEEWNKGPFSKQSKKDEDDDGDTKVAESTPQAANILKRSISDAGEEDNQEAKKLKLEAAAAKVRRSASYDNERIHNKETTESVTELRLEDTVEKNDKVISNQQEMEQKSIEETKDTNDSKTNKATLNSETTKDKDPSQVKIKVDNGKQNVTEPQQKDLEKTEETSSNTSSSNSSSDSSSDDSSSDSSSSSSSETASTKSANQNNPITDKEIMTIISACLDSLEDCASRFPQHYKAIYRLAHYHFYYKKGKDIERCRDLMLSNFTSRCNQKLGGLFCERKQSNFFNGVWRIPLGEVDRPGGFSCHMNRCVLLTMEILKEIDDHKTLLDLNLHLQRVPEPDKKYLRDADREELAQQAFSLCIQSLKGQVVKFSQQADLKSNNVERQALNSLMLDIYRAWLRAQKQPNAKQFTSLLVEAYKLVAMTPINENTNLVDISLKYCQALIAALKQKATIASMDKNNQNIQKKQAAKISEPVKSITSATHTKADHKSTSTVTPAVTTKSLPSISAQMAAYQNYLPTLNDPLLSQQTAAALSLYMSNLSAIAGYSLQNTLQSSMQNSLQNSFQSEFYRQFLSSSYTPFNLPPPKKHQKRPKPATSRPHVPTSMGALNTQAKGMPKPYTSVNKSAPSVIKHTTALTTLNMSTAVTSTMSKSFGAPVLPAHISTSQPGHVSTSHLAHASTSQPAHASTTQPARASTSQPAHASAQQPARGSTSQPAHVSTTQSARASTSQPHASSMQHGSGSEPTQAHNISNSSTVNTTLHNKPPMPHHQVSPGKTLQEKLAERQKQHPTAKTAHNINASISRLPSSLTITKSSAATKKPEAKKALSYNENEAARPKPSLTSNEIIVLDDDD